MWWQRCACCFSSVRLHVSFREKLAINIFSLLGLDLTDLQLKVLTAETPISCSLFSHLWSKLRQPREKAVNCVCSDSVINLPSSSSQWEVSAEPVRLAAFHFSVPEDRQAETQRPSRLTWDSVSSLLHSDSCRSECESECKLKGSGE